MACTCRTPRLTRSSTSKPVKRANVQKTSTKKKPRGRPKSSPTGKDYSLPVEKKSKEQVAKMLKGKKNLFNVKGVSDEFVQNYSSNTKKYNSVHEKVRKYFFEF